MATIKGDNSKNGKVGKLVYYKLDGKEICKSIGVVDKERYKKDNCFQKLRENNSEFGVASTIGAIIRHGLAPFPRDYGDNTNSGRLTGVLRRIMGLGHGESGKRSFELKRNGALMEGFEFKKINTFGSAFFAPFVKPHLVDSKLVWEIPDFNAKNFVRAPKSATHFQLVLGYVLVSDYFFDSTINKYAVVNDGLNGVSELVACDPIMLKGNVGDGIYFEVDLGLTSEEHVNVRVVVTMGIVFYQCVNDDLYELSDAIAMQIGGVL